MGSHRKRYPELFADEKYPIPITGREHALLSRLRQLVNRQRCGTLIVSWEEGKITLVQRPSATLDKLENCDIIESQ
jgi:hypothetical protein